MCDLRAGRRRTLPRRDFEQSLRRLLLRQAPGTRCVRTAGEPRLGQVSNQGREALDAALRLQRPAHPIARTPQRQSGPAPVCSWQEIHRLVALGITDSRFHGSLAGSAGLALRRLRRRSGSGASVSATTSIPPRVGPKILPGRQHRVPGTDTTESRRGREPRGPQ